MSAHTQSEYGLYSIPIYRFRSEYIFKFDKTFEMHDDIEVLKRMGFLLGECV